MLHRKAEKLYFHVFILYIDFTFILILSVFLSLLIGPLLYVWESLGTIPLSGKILKIGAGGKRGPAHAQIFAKSAQTHC